MARDKNKKPEESKPEESLLEKRIDEMMDPKAPEPSTTPITPPAPATEVVPTIDIFKDAKTAPKVSPELLKQIGIEEKPKSKQVKVIDSEHKEDVESKPEEVEEPTKEDSDVTEPEPEEVISEAPETEVSDEEPFDDEETDRAVDEIAAEDSDKILEVEDAEMATEPLVVKHKERRKLSIKSLLKSKKFWLILVVLLIAVFAVPVSRYKVLGLVYKPGVTLTILDSETNTPVTNAEVSLHGSKGKTDSSGVAKIKAKPGKGSLKVTKQYYKTYAKEHFVGLKSKQSQIKMVATGRQVPVRILNSITGEPVKDAEIKVLSSTSKTDKDGKTVIVLPASDKKQPASIQSSGYNDKKSELVITERADQRNTFTITPKGKLYFLSNLSGKVDVVKSDLDGTNRQVVVEGTGKEDERSTSLLAARDWRYLVLKARRDSSQASLYLLDTQTDKLTRFDTGTGDFELIGWYGHSFIYSVTRPTTSVWQSGRQAIKSYDAERGELNQIDQTQAEGSATSHAYQSFNNFYILDNLVTYNVTWFATGMDLASKKSSIRAATPTGKDKKDYQSFDASSLSYFAASLYEPQEVYYAAYENNGKVSFYEFEDKKVTLASGIDQADFSKTYPTYLISPNSSRAFWSDFRDGKNTLFTGAASDLSSKKQIATLSEYAPYGWFSDDYLLVSKNSSELFITTEKNLSAEKPPLKVTDYFKPAQNFSGYGYGYGGL